MMSTGQRTKTRLRGVKRMLFMALKIALLTYCGLLLLLIILQRQFIYYPTKESEAQLLEKADLHQLRPWRDAAGNLIGWKSTYPGPKPLNRLLVFHGNAGYALDREYFIQGFQSVQQGKLWEIYLFEYPGYGGRPGTPGEESFEAAAGAAFEQLRQSDERPIYLAGESLGCGVAAQLAGQYRGAVAGLFLVTPFTNLGDVAAYHYPIFPVRLFLRDRYASDETLKNYNGLLAVLLVGRDEVVPTRFGQRLYDGYKGTKRLWMQAQVSHNTIDYDPDAVWWREVSDFLLSNITHAR
jgi:pimeloyl-ACP methyl ester carboxylesterase